MVAPATISPGCATGAARLKSLASLDLPESRVYKQFEREGASRERAFSLAAPQRFKGLL